MEIAICDDCLDVIGTLEEIITDCFKTIGNYNCDAYLSGEELLAVIAGDEQRYQMYVLDIEMKELDGIELAHRIRAKNMNSIIIFITNHKELMQSVFEVNAFHFLVKPIEFEKAKQVFLKAIYALKIGKLVFQYKIRKAVYSIFYTQIILFESYKRKITIYTENDTCDFYGSLNDIIDEVNHQVFVQVHKSYIVNMNYIKYMEREAIVLFNGQRICVTKKYHKTFNDAYSNFILMRS
jgi:DNA-binding LytR/AlgR family response regulator